MPGFVPARLGEHEGKFVAAETSGCVNRAATVAQRISHAFDGATSGQMSVAVVDFFEPVEVEKKHGEAAAGAARTLDFCLENFHQLAMVCEASERIGRGQMAYLIKEAGIIKQSPAQNDYVTQDYAELRNHRGCVEVAFGLGSW